MSIKKENASVKTNIIRCAPVVGVGVLSIAVLFGIVEIIKLAGKKQSDDERVRQDVRDSSTITVAQTLASIASAIIAIGTVSLAAKRAGLSNESSLGVAAVLTIILALATQSLSHEIVSSIIFMLERRAATGDAVSVFVKDARQAVKGVVAEIGISSISLRASDKSIVHIPFSSISYIVNESENDQLAIVRIPVDPSYHPGKAVAAVREICDLIRDDSNISHALHGAPFVHGIDSDPGAFFYVVIHAPCRETHKVSVSNYISLVVSSELARLGVPRPSLSVASLSHIPPS